MHKTIYENLQTCKLLGRLQLYSGASLRQDDADAPGIEDVRGEDGPENDGRDGTHEQTRLFSLIVAGCFGFVFCSRGFFQLMAVFFLASVVGRLAGVVQQAKN
jgi:hypothetical protein